MIQGFVLELSPSDKLPGIYLSTLFGIGNSSSSGFQKFLLLVGLKDATAGTMIPDTDVLDITSESDVDTFAGPGSELARMGYAALSIGGVQIKIACPAITSATAATATITISTTGSAWTTAGQWSLRIAGVALTGGILAADTPATVSANIAAAVNARAKLPVTAAAVAGVSPAYVVTLTAKSAGVRGNDLMLWQDTSGLPANCTSAIAGGTAVGNGAKRFSGGAAVEDITNVLATLFTDRYFRIAAAQKDATNLGRWNVQIDTKAGPLEGRMEHVVFAVSGTLSAASTLAKTALNEPRAELMWMQDSETFPPEIAALHAAQRAQAEQSNPNRSYDGVELTGTRGQTDRPTNPNRATKVAALDAGVTVIETVNGVAKVVRAVTTHSLTSAGAVDNGTVDVADSAVVDAVRDETRAFWTNEFAVNNPYLTDDPAADAVKTPDTGVAYPRLWANELTQLFKRLEDLQWLVHVDNNPVKAWLNPYAGTPRIVFFAPTERLPHQHQIEGTIAQKVFKAAA